MCDGLREGVVVLDAGKGKLPASNGAPWFRTDLPMADDGSPGSAYKDVRFIVRDGAGLNLTDDVTVREVDIPTDDTRIILTGHTLRILPTVHRHGRGWAAGMETLVLDGDASGGRIVWGAEGTLLPPNFHFPPDDDDAAIRKECFT